jgi:hypothetical protein
VGPEKHQYVRTVRTYVGPDEKQHQRDQRRVSAAGPEKPSAHLCVVLFTVHILRI